MAAPAKFLFDTDFATPDKSRERPTQAEMAQKIAAAEAKAYRDGYDAGQREAKAESDRRSALALEEIKIAMQGIAARFAGVERRMETEAVDVAVAVARKLCSELIAAEPLGEVTGLVSECFSHLVATPHLVVRVNDQLYEAARERIERLAKPSGFQGRLVILAEPNLPTGDCKIEWADGGVVLERAAIEAKIDELVGRYMASRNQGTDQGTES
jgi:flagellar assembly protein FliH